MNASIVELRYQMKSVLEALDRHEEVTVSHRGKVRGILKPIPPKTMKVQDHPFFGSVRSSEKVEKIMDRLRAPRHVV